MASACGIQSLINEVGPIRVFLAWSIGACFKVFRIKGMFYRLAGSQARLIDDITGTTPPYDQVIVLGPIKTSSFCESLAFVWHCRERMRIGALESMMMHFE